MEATLLAVRMRCEDVDNWESLFKMRVSTVN